jgi:SNF2 family DNA or RNA helicase
MDERKALWSEMKKKTMVPGGNKAGVNPVVITSYEVSMKDRFPLQYKHWDILIIDEGHRIKNFQCKLVA